MYSFLLCTYILEFTEINQWYSKLQTFHESKLIPHMETKYRVFFEVSTYMKYN